MIDFIIGAASPGAVRDMLINQGFLIPDDDVEGGYRLRWRGLKLTPQGVPNPIHGDETKLFLLRFSDEVLLDQEQSGRQRPGNGPPPGRPGNGGPPIDPPGRPFLNTKFGRWLGNNGQTMTKGLKDNVRPVYDEDGNFTGEYEPILDDDGNQIPETIIEGWRVNLGGETFFVTDQNERIANWQ